MPLHAGARVDGYHDPQCKCQVGAPSGLVRGSVAVANRQSFRWSRKVKSSCVEAPSHPHTVHGWDPHTYSAFTAKVEHYGELQAAVVDATRDLDVATVLDLGIGTGETTRRLVSTHEEATFVGVDANQAMLDAAKISLPPERTTFVLGHIEGPLPPGPFDLVVSVLAVHHLDSPTKAALFARISAVLAPTGRFVLGDVVLDPHISSPHESTAARLHQSLRGQGVAGTARSIRGWLWRRMTLNWHQAQGNIDLEDHPDLLVDQIAWLTEAGLSADVVWEKAPLVVVIANKARRHQS